MGVCCPPLSGMSILVYNITKLKRKSNNCLQQAHLHYFFIVIMLTIGILYLRAKYMVICMLKYNHSKYVLIVFVMLLK